MRNMPPETPTKWEVVHVTATVTRTLRDEINAYGDLGYELVSVTTRPHPITEGVVILDAFLKRPKIAPLTAK